MMDQPLNPTEYRRWIRTTLEEGVIWEEHTVASGRFINHDGETIINGLALQLPKEFALSSMIEGDVLRITVGGVHVGTVFKLTSVIGTRFVRHLVPLAQFPRGTVKTQG